MSGHCPYADSILTARKCFSNCNELDESGIPIERIDEPSIYDLNLTAKKIIDCCSVDKCFCPKSEECKTVKDVKELVESLA